MKVSASSSDDALSLKLLKYTLQEVFGAKSTAPASTGKSQGGDRKSNSPNQFEKKTWIAKSADEQCKSDDEGKKANVAVS